MFQQGAPKPVVNRRALLKYFGIGTVIAPVAGAAPLARLIEVPKVEIVEAATIPAPLDLRRVESFTLTLNLEDGTQRTVKSHYVSCERGTGEKLSDPEVFVMVDFRKVFRQSPVFTERIDCLSAYGVVL
jgi:hypothetical protein